MSSFHNISFPLPLAFGASGGPSRTTEIVTLVNGREHRNATSYNSRRRYDAGVGVKTLDDLHLLLSFYEARMGELYGFRFRDPLDHKSCAPAQTIKASDQSIGLGDGVRSDFQLIKTYADTQGAWVREITKPVLGSVVVSIGGADSTGFTLDGDTGVISFTDPPATGAEISAGFAFDVPVRFATDHLSSALEAFGAGQAVHIPLIEVLPHA